MEIFDALLRLRNDDRLIVEVTAERGKETHLLQQQVGLVNPLSASIGEKRWGIFYLRYY